MRTLALEEYLMQDSEFKMISSGLKALVIETESKYAYDNFYWRYINAYLLLKAYRKEELGDGAKEAINKLNVFYGSQIKEIYERISEETKKSERKIGKDEINNRLLVELNKEKSKALPFLKEFVDSNKSYVLNFIIEHKPEQMSKDVIKINAPSLAVFRKEEV